MLKICCLLSGRIFVVKTFMNKMVKNYQLCIVREQNMQQNDSESRRNYFLSTPSFQKIVFSPQPLSVEKLVQNWYKNGTKFGTKATVPIPISRFSAAPKSWPTTNGMITTLRSLIPKLVRRYQLFGRYPNLVYILLTFWFGMTGCLHGGQFFWP